MKPSPHVNLGNQRIERRELIKLLSIGGVVSVSGLVGCSSAATPAPQSPATNAPPGAEAHSALEDFVFLQLSDTHWGYSGANNPEADVTLKRAVQEINASSLNPDFIVFTGDLSHTTDDDAVRRRRLQEFRSIVDDLKVAKRYYLPGEHDAGPDAGAAFREVIGETHGVFDHKGVHFVMLDNVSAPGSVIGDAQLEWLAQDLAKLGATTPLVVLTHRPLFPLFPSWDWTTADGSRALEIIAKHPSATVFYGHIHQEHHFKTGNIEHHAARSLIFPLPAPGSVEKKAALPWDPTSRDHGLGYRQARERAGTPEVAELGLNAQGPA